MSEKDKTPEKKSEPQKKDLRDKTIKVLERMAEEEMKELAVLKLKKEILQTKRDIAKLSRYDSSGGKKETTEEDVVSEGLKEEEGSDEESSGED